MHNVVHHVDYQVNEWLPICTAPSTGVYVMALFEHEHDEHSRYGFVRWDIQAGSWHPYFPEWITGRSESSLPTHWVDWPAVAAPTCDWIRDADSK